MIQVGVSGTEQVLARFTSMPDQIRTTLREAMQRQLFAVQSQTVTGKLSGDPLHRRTGVLASSINVQLVEDASGFVGKVGTKTVYAAIHEYGGTVQVPAHGRRITEVFGKPVTSHEIEVRAHAAHYPERSFLRSTLNAMQAQIKDALENAVAEATHP